MSVSAAQVSALQSLSLHTHLKRLIKDSWPKKKKKKKKKKKNSPASNGLEEDEERRGEDEMEWEGDKLWVFSFFPDNLHSSLLKTAVTNWLTVIHSETTEGGWAGQLSCCRKP